MNWYDLLLLIPIALLVLFELRQEAGRGLLDATVTLAAVQLTNAYAGFAGELAHFPAGPGGGPAPIMYGFCFLVFWGAGLAFSRLLHRKTRWSMDQFDPLFGLVFGLTVAITFGHVMAEFTAAWSTAHWGHEPLYVRESRLADELRSFRTLQAVLDTLHSYQYHS